MIGSTLRLLSPAIHRKAHSYRHTNLRIRSRRIASSMRFPVSRNTQRSLDAVTLKTAHLAIRMAKAQMGLRMKPKINRSTVSYRSDGINAAQIHTQTKAPSMSVVKRYRRNADDNARSGSEPATRIAAQSATIAERPHRSMPDMMQTIRPRIGHMIRTPRPLSRPCSPDKVHCTPWVFIDCTDRTAPPATRCRADLSASLCTGRLRPPRNPGAIIGGRESFRPTIHLPGAYM